MYQKGLSAFSHSTTPSFGRSSVKTMILTLSAESPRMAQSKDIKDFQRILECSICLERMKNPRCLPCLHTFCEKCIGQHMDEKQRDGSFPCPVCTLKFQVPQEGVTGFKRNLYLVQMSELFPEESEVKCDVCKLQDVENTAASMCIQCTDHLCQRCAEYHFLSKFTHSHKVVSLEEVRSGQHLEEMRRFQEVHCPMHKDKVMEIYCETCVKPLCLLCAMLEHDNHKKGNIGEAAKNADDVLRGLQRPWQMASDHSAILSTERKKVLDSFDKQEEQLIDEMKQLYKTFKEEFLEEINVKMNESIKNLKMEIASARKQAEVAYNDAEFSRLTITSTFKYLQEILHSTQDAEKLQHFPDLKIRLENLDIGKLENEVTTYLFKLQPGALVMPDLIMKMVSETGKERFTPTLHELTRLCDMKESATLVRCCNGKCPGEGTFESCGLAVTDDWMVTTNMSSGKVKVFDRSSGRFLFEVDQSQHKLQRPEGVTCSRKGDIFVTGIDAKGVVRYNSKGQLVKVTRDLCTGCSSGITCHQDQLIVTDYSGDRVLVTDFDCNVIKVISKESLGLTTFKPWNVCVDNEGHLVVSDLDQGRVHLIDYRQPVIVKTFSEGLSASPCGVCVDEWGHILVADWDNTQVALMSGESEGARVIISSDDISIPTGLAITGPGEVAVLEYFTGNVKVFKYANV